MLAATVVYCFLCMNSIDSTLFVADNTALCHALACAGPEHRDHDGFYFRNREKMLILVLPLRKYKGCLMRSSVIQNYYVRSGMRWAGTPRSQSNSADRERRFWYSVSVLSPWSDRGRQYAETCVGWKGRDGGRFRGPGKTTISAIMFSTIYFPVNLDSGTLYYDHECSMWLSYTAFYTRTWLLQHIFRTVQALVLILLSDIGSST